MDYEGLTHVEAAQRMDVSRTTVTEIYDSARRKLADALVNGYRLEITGGNTRVCGGASDCPGCSSVPVEIVSEASLKGANTMRIAVTYENGQIFQHFGHTEQFKIYDIDNEKIVSSEVVGNNGFGHGSLAGYLKSLGVEALICGGIGGGARNMLGDAGIKVYPGANGNADAQVEAFIKGSLNYDPNTTCHHHDHGDSCTCGH
jgi:predicted Fe-Mo cluster-binding NifX family protein